MADLMEIKAKLSAFAEQLDEAFKLMRYDISRCFLVSNGLFDHWEKQLFGIGARTSSSFGIVFRARSDVMAVPEAASQFYESDWRAEGTWFAKVKATFATLKTMANEIVLPGAPENQNGPCWGAYLMRSVGGLEGALAYQAENWRTSDSPWSNEAPEINYAKVWSDLENCRKWTQWAEQQLVFAAYAEMKSKEAASTAVKSAKLKTPKGGREGQIMAAVQELALGGENPTKAKVAQVVGLDKSALSKGDLKSAYERAMELVRGKLPDGMKDSEGNLEAVDNVEE